MYILFCPFTVKSAKGLHKSLFSITLISALTSLLRPLLRSLKFVFFHPIESFIVLSFIAQIHLEFIFVNGKSDFPIDPALFVERHH